MHIIVDDAPGRRIEIQWTGLPPGILRRVGLTLCFAPFVLAPAVLATVAIANSASQALVLVPFLAIWYAGLTFGLMVIGSSCVYPRRLCITNDAGVQVHFGGWMLWGRRTMAFSTPQIHGLRFEIRPEGQAVGTTCLIRTTGKPGKGRGKQRGDDLRVDLDIQGIERRKEAMDLAFRFAHVLGWCDYQVTRNDPRRLDLNLVRSLDAKSRAKAVPSVDAARYELDAPLPNFQEPELRLPPFNAAAFPSPYQVQDWFPGRCVRLYRPRVPAWAAVAVGLITGVVGGTAGTLVLYMIALPLLALMAPGIEDWKLPPLPIAATLGVGAALICGAGTWFAGRERQIGIDWVAGTASFSSGRSLHIASLSDIHELIVRGKTDIQTESYGTGEDRSTRKYPVYWCQVEMVLTGPDQVIAVTNRFREDPDAPYLKSLSMAVELARALGVGWRWEEYD